MDKLNAPWRMDYILEERDNGCFLCKACACNDDEKHMIILRGETCFIIMNKYPYNNGHVMVAPFRHIAALDDFTDKELLEMMSLLRETQHILDKSIKPDGYNIGINQGRVAGAGLLDHLHLHVVPRWNGDTNFMPVISDTKVMPQYLHKTYKEILKAVK